MNHILGIATLSSLRLQLSAGTETRPSPPAALRRPPCKWPGPARPRGQKCISVKTVLLAFSAIS